MCVFESAGKTCFELKLAQIFIPLCNIYVRMIVESYETQSCFRMEEPNMIDPRNNSLIPTIQ